ncbi:MAG: hypothetical protein FWE98_03985 [Oscillospiraceae bacterium]|nr:hypothetical protein [Oscillospiraceae bacterium]
MGTAGGGVCSMAAHDYLSQYLALQSDIERWKRVAKTLAGDEYEAWIVSNGARLITNYSDMPRSKQGIDHVASAATVLAQKDYDREKYTRENIQNARAVQLQILQAIDAVPVGQVRQVLDLKYLQGQSMQIIADNMECSVKTVQRIASKGLSLIEVPADAALDGRTQCTAAAA